MSAVQALMESSLLEPSFTALTPVPDKSALAFVFLVFIFFILFYLQANLLKAEVRALHSDPFYWLFPFLAS